jgi:hypothetical protein
MMSGPRMSLAWLLLAVATSGCSLVYDADDLRGARGDGGPSADADPDALFVARVTPDAVFEGEGSSFDPDKTEMVRAIPIVLEGQNMTAETVFTIAGLGIEMEIEEVAVSGDGHFAAFAFRVPIDPELTDGDVGMKFTIRLAKGDEENTAPQLVVTGLDALEQTDGTIATDGLRARYTHVDLSGGVTATGTAPLRIVATAGIRLDGALRADAGTAPAAGPGGCPGGQGAAAALCGDGSGQAGETSGTPGGGGGGGYGTAGTAGAGGAGQPGGMAGQRFVVPLPPAEDATARGAGGGGGGDLTLEAGGAVGGGSGGVIELTTPAILEMSASAALSAAGGDGATVACTLGGGGGGGSGGAILVRAATLLAEEGARADAPGGMGNGNTAACRGGDGGKGRIRIDRGNDVAIETDPAAFIGPVLPDLPVIVSEELLSVEVRGEATDSYELFAAGERLATVDTGADGIGSAEVALEPGLNQLCVQVAPAADLQYPEAKNCVNVAYIAP